MNISGCGQDIKAGFQDMKPAEYSTGARSRSWILRCGRETRFHVSSSLSVGKGRQAAFPLMLRVGAKQGHIMDELRRIQQASQTKCFPHQCKTAGNLIDFINISKERMCQSEGGFGGEGLRMKRRALAV